MRRTPANYHLLKHLYIQLTFSTAPKITTKQSIHAHLSLISFILITFFTKKNLNTFDEKFDRSHMTRVRELLETTVRSSFFFIAYWSNESWQTLVLQSAVELRSPEGRFDVSICVRWYAGKPLVCQYLSLLFRRFCLKRLLWT